MGKLKEMKDIVDQEIYISEWQVRFCQRFRITEDGCWIWVGASGDNNPYGAHKINGGNHPPHHVAWFIEHGLWPTKGMHIHHLCEQKLCVNPDHLQELTMAEHASITSKAHGGGAHGRALAPTQHQRLLDLRNAGWTQRELSVEFNITLLGVQKYIKRSIDE